MIRAIGAALVVASCAGIGFRIASNYRRRPAELRMLSQAVRLLQSEIEYRFTPLPDALVDVARRTPAPVDALFRTAGEMLRTTEASVVDAFVHGIAVCAPRSVLLPQDFAIIEEFGKTLGISDRVHQSQQIAVTLTQLSTQEADARETQRRNERLWQYLGVLSGLLIVVLLY